MALLGRGGWRRELLRVHSDPGDRTSPLKLHRLDGLVVERAPRLTLE
jgi:hypothetical protein